jgi:TolB-like protein/Tfp pilus assembly protein PilF
MSTPERFGQFELNASTYELRRAGQSVKLERIPMDLLLLLAANKGRLVSRDEVVEHIWGKERFVDTGSAINTAIRKIRRVLGDDPERPRFIETVPGKGYRFIANSVPRTTVAVLPLENLSTEAGNDYLCEGITEELITRLGELAPGQLGVIARTSAVQCMRRQLTISQIGRELGVDFILEGGMRRHADSVRISARLIRTEGQAQFWARTYERPLTAVATLQDDLAREIAFEVKAELPVNDLSVNASGRPARNRPINIQAYECYLRGRHFWNKKTPDGYAKSLAFYQQSIDFDPAYALPYAGLADTWIMLGIHGLSPAHDVYPRATAAARRALEIDDTLAEAHTALADVNKGYAWDWERAEAGYQKALELNTNYAVAHQWYANLLSILGRHTEALQQVKLAKRIDPLSVPIAGFVAFTYFRARQYEEGIIEARKALEFDPASPIALWFLGQLYVATGQFDLAVSTFSKAVEESPTSMFLGSLGHAHGREGNLQAAKQTASRLEKLSSERYVSPFDICMTYTGMGEFDTAFAWLEKAIDQRVMRVTELPTAAFDCLRVDSRFAGMLARVGLSEPREHASSELSVSSQ